MSIDIYIDTYIHTYVHISTYQHTLTYTWRASKRPPAPWSFFVPQVAQEALQAAGSVLELSLSLEQMSGLDEVGLCSSGLLVV